MTHFVPILALRVPCPGNRCGKAGQLVPWSRVGEEPERGMAFYVNVVVYMRHELLEALVLEWPVNQATHGGTRMNTGIQVWSLGGRQAGDAGKAETARVIAWQWGVRERKEPWRRVTFWLRGLVGGVSQGKEMVCRGLAGRRALGTVSQQTALPPPVLL